MKWLFALLTFIGCPNTQAQLGPINAYQLMLFDTKIGDVLIVCTKSEKDSLWCYIPKDFGVNDVDDEEYAKKEAELVKVKAVISEFHLKKAKFLKDCMNWEFLDKSKTIKENCESAYSDWQRRGGLVWNEKAKTWEKDKDPLGLFKGQK